MKVIVIGASAGVGAATVRAAVAAGHTVTAFARHPERLMVASRDEDRVHRFTGDVLEAETVARAVCNHDAVIVTLGLPTLAAIGRGKSTVISAGTAHVIDAMRQHHVRRLIALTAIGSGQSAADLTRPAGWALRGGLGYLFREKDEQERLTRDSGLDWTIVRPTALTNGPATSHARLHERFRAGVLTHVSRADVAQAMVRMLDEHGAIGKALAISYPNRSGLDWARWLRHYK